MAASDFDAYLAKMDPEAAYLVLKPAGPQSRGKLLLALTAHKMRILEEVGFDEQGRIGSIGPSAHALVLKLQPAALRDFIFELAREGLEGELTGYEVQSGGRTVWGELGSSGDAA